MSDSEIIIIVDKQNHTTGTATRLHMRQNNLIHRASYIVVYNASNEVFVQKRTQTKDIYPGYQDIAAGGVVLANESYEESARRELQEELGITAPLTFQFDHFYQDKNNKVWGRIFSCTHHGPFTLQVEEVESGQFMPVQTILSPVNPHQFTPDGIEILQRLHL